MTVDRRWLRVVLITLILAVALSAGTWALTSSRAAVLLVAAMTGLALVQVPAQGGVRYSLSLAALASAPLVIHDVVGRDVVMSLTVVGLGTIGSLVPLAAGAATLRSIATRAIRLLLAGAVFLGVFWLLLDVTLGELSEEPAGALTLSISAAVFAWFFVNTAVWALVAQARSHQVWRHFFIMSLQAWPVAASVLATGVFFGIAWTATFWWWALPVSLLPYAFAHVAFHRAHETQRTYRQTIRALSRIPEVSALSPDGHGDRTASLSLDIAAELGVPPKNAQDLEYAAQMHDIGRIALNQPSILRMGFSDEDIARWGAEMVAEVSYLSDAAELVLKQHEPYRRPGEQKDPDLPIGAKIIKAASAYDHATTELGFMPVEALEVLHRGAAYDYDPDVVTAIRTVLEREGTVS